MSTINVPAKCAESRKTIFFEVTTRSILSYLRKTLLSGSSRGIYGFMDQGSTAKNGVGSGITAPGSGDQDQ